MNDVNTRLAEALRKLWEDQAGEALNTADLGIVGETLDAYTTALAPVVNGLMQQAWNEGYDQAVTDRENNA